MKWSSNLRVFAIFGTFFFFYSCTAQKNPTYSSFEDIIIQEGQANNFSGTTLVAKGDSILFIKSAGYADRERQILNDTNTKFNIASTGKLLTRIIILQLIQEGKLKFEDPINHILPGFTQPAADQITILHLLEHTSGLGDIYVSKEYLRPEVFSSMDKVVELIAKEKLAFTPGTKEQYSNSGYYLLSAIIAKKDNKNFAEAMNDRIFKPLGMKNSGFANTGDHIDGHAIPYKKKGSSIRKSEVEVAGEPPSGAGSQYSTVIDLYKLYRSIVKDQILLSDQSKALLFNRFKPGNWNEILKSKKITGYLGGDTRGWSAKLTFLFYENGSYGTVVLANFDQMAHPLDLKLREVINSKL